METSDTKDFNDRTEELYVECFTEIIMAMLDVTEYLIVHVLFVVHIVAQSSLITWFSSLTGRICKVDPEFRRIRFVLL